MDHAMNHVSVQEADPGDCVSIRELALEANIDAWSEADYYGEILRPESFVLKATISGKLVGFLVARIVPGMTDRPDAELYNVGVANEHKRK